MFPAATTQAETKGLMEGAGERLGSRCQCSRVVVPGAEWEAGRKSERWEADAESLGTLCEECIPLEEF